MSHPRLITVTAQPRVVVRQSAGGVRVVRESSPVRLVRVLVPGTPGADGVERLRFTATLGGSDFFILPGRVASLDSLGQVEPCVGTPVGVTAGFAMLGDPVTVQVGGVLGGLSGLTPGATYWWESLSTGGELTPTPPTNGPRWVIGRARSATELVIEIGESPDPAAGRYTHTQGSADTTWTVNHNLGVRPQVEVRSPGGVVVWAEVTHTSDNQCVISFSSPQTGTAYCSL